MKYIKKYENTTFNKYIIAYFKDAKKYYMFRRIPNLDLDDMYYDKYWYYIGGNILIDADDDNHYFEYKKVFDIVFQTNSFEEALSILELTNNKNIMKFNI